MLAMCTLLSHLLVHEAEIQHPEEPPALEWLLKVRVLQAENAARRQSHREEGSADVGGSISDSD